MPYRVVVEQAAYDQLIGAPDDLALFVLEFLDTVAADPYESTAEYRVVVGRDSCDAIFSGGHGFVTYEVREAAGTINVVAVTPAAS